MLLLKDAIAFGREEPANLLHRTRCRPMVLEKASEGWALNGSEAVRISLCGLTPRPSLAPLSALSTISSSHHAHPSMPLLAKIEQRWQKPDKGKLLLLRFDGSMVFEIPAPPLREGSPEWETPGYTDCRFDDSGRYLWCAARISADEIEVQLRETDGWSVVSQTVVEDPLGEASATFFPTPDPGTFSLYLAEAGGDTRVYWAARDGVHTRFALEPSLCDAPPVFAPSGREFLVIDFTYGTVQRYRYPVVQTAGVCESPFGADEPFHVSLCYLDDTRALAGSLNGRIAVLDTPTMHVVNELAVDGHDDISSFTRLGDYLIFFHDDEETNGMLCFPISYILDRYAR